MASGLPEDTNYPDTGCEIAPRCLECPLPQCKYDSPGLALRHKRKQRDQEIVSLLDQGHSVAEVAELLGLSQETVFRISQREARWLGRMTPSMRRADALARVRYGQDLATYLRWAVLADGLEAAGVTFGTTKTTIHRWLSRLGLHRETVYLLPGQSVEVVDELDP